MLLLSLLLPWLLSSATNSTASIQGDPFFHGVSQLIPS